MADDEAPAPDTRELVDDDQPRPLTPDLPPEVASPLSPFAGAAPPTPAWFDEALAQTPERTRVPVLGAMIEMLTWGEIGRPGLILVHGNSAHADWWSFVAPYLAKTHRVAALSISGMGGSDWRDSYSFETFASEIHACAQAAGLYEGGRRPVYVGHSFGGSQVYYSAVRHAERMSACLLVDTGFGGPPTPEEMALMEKEAAARGEPAGRWRGPPQRSGPHRVYATLEQALTRFRFMPPQAPGNLFIADFIARRSLKRAPLPDGGEGWTWKFDPGLWSKLDRTEMFAAPKGTASVPMAHIYGDRSAIIRRHHADGRDAEMLGPDIPRIVIPESEHHVMVDQPLALVAAIRAVLAMWLHDGVGAA
ncbi:MAG TPA: alpha/beta hydrolase [Caulobacteraceae bacterium]|jgi:pimeloyl-ACP methyl ester carboxylesterase|nr:alpha/beta hydrolase [Caulobacteraceae bacterium]